MARMRALRVRRKPHTVFFKYGKLRKNRPREQDFDVWRTSAEVKAGSARFFNAWESHEDCLRKREYNALRTSAEVNSIRF